MRVCRAVLLLWSMLLLLVVVAKTGEPRGLGPRLLLLLLL
jgi:hypothetical protein